MTGGKEAYAKGEAALLEGELGHALLWFEQACDEGSANACFALGQMYNGGHGVPTDAERGWGYTRTAAERGHALAQYILALGLRNGTPMAQHEGRRWMRAAAEQGMAWAQFALAEQHYYGIGIPRDCAEALRWSRRIRCREVRPRDPHFCLRHLTLRLQLIVARVRTLLRHAIGI